MCVVRMQVANYLVRDLAQNTMTAELLQPDELVSGLIAQVGAPASMTSCHVTQMRFLVPVVLLGAHVTRQSHATEVSVCS